MNIVHLLQILDIFFKRHQPLQLVSSLPYLGCLEHLLSISPPSINIHLAFKQFFESLNILLSLFLGIFTLLFEQLIDVVLEYLISISLIDGHELFVVAKSKLLAHYVVLTGAGQLYNAKITTLVDEGEEKLPLSLLLQLKLLTLFISRFMEIVSEN